MQLILEKIGIFNYRHSKLKHKNCVPTQCKIILSYFSVWYKNTLGLCWHLLCFIWKYLQTVQKWTSGHAFTNNTLFLTIIQCKRVKHFYYIFFFKKNRCVIEAVAKSWRDQNWARFFQAWKRKECVRKAGLTSVCNNSSCLLRGCAWRHLLIELMKLSPGEILGDSLQKGLSACNIFTDSPSKDTRVSMV